MVRHGKQIPTSSKNSFAARAAHSKARKEFVTYDTSAIRPKKSKKPLIIISILVLIVIALICFFLLSGCSNNNIGDLNASESASVVIESGDSAKQISEKFKDAKLVRDSNLFLDLLKNKGYANSIIPGTYTFNGKTEPETMAARISKGEFDSLPKVTVVEGYTLKRIASAVEEASNKRISAASFLEEASDSSKYVSEFSFLESAKNNSLEGFLFPKTYDIEDKDTATSLIKKMLSQFQLETDNLSFDYPSKYNMTLYDAIKLASIVQKESNVDNHKMIAGIFYNRLNSDSPYLQSDATTAYIVGHDPTAEEVHANDPYSTYSNAGLPPTPICNPDLSSINAVLDPEKTDYMFFYTNNDGSYAYSKTYDEHKEAIARDQKSK